MGDHEVATYIGAAGAALAALLGFAWKVVRLRARERHDELEARAKEARAYAETIAANTHAIDKMRARFDVFLNRQSSAVYRISDDSLDEHPGR